VTVDVRPAESDADIEHWLATVDAVLPELRLTLAEIRAIQREAEIAYLLATTGGEPTGAAVWDKQPRLREARSAHANIYVPDRHRSRGVGSTLYAALSDDLRSRDVDGLETIVSDDDPASLAWAERRGFEVQRREPRVELDIRDLEPQPIDPPDGIDIVTWAERPELTEGMYEVAVETYRDIPGSEDDTMETFEEWLAQDMQGPGDLPEATFIALAGNEVVGYAKFSLTAAQPTVAYHDLTGVKRAWRGRGIAGALKRAEVAWAKQAGYERLSTANEERNEPIRRLNARLGYRPARGRIFLRGPLAAR
jgi:GNAT superfamily N-acetyltransferase